MLEELTMRDSLTRWAGKLTVVGAAAVVAPILAMVTAPAAQAATVLPCTTRVTTTPFTAWGDTNDYFTAPGGPFEGGAPGWILGRALVVPGNEPWKVLSSSDDSSLGILGGGLAVTPAMCIGTAEDSM